MRILRSLSVVLLLGSVACESPGPDHVLADRSAPVPDVVGFARHTALESLRAEGFVAVVKRKWTAYARQGEVISQSPAGGRVFETGADVVIVVARMLREVPDVHGFRLERARRILRSKGFRVQVVKGSGGILGAFIDPGRVVRTRPGEFATRRPGSIVTVVVKRAPPPAPEPDPVGCHSAYSGCVPIASDVDCAGGSGDGPAYVNGPVYLKGSYDPYDLDGYDNDGIGCE
jgi:PASTA domain-containing protein